VVYVHASAEGWHQGRLAREEFVKAYYPKIITGRHWRAISWTTAASVCAVIELVNNGILPDKGFIKQEEIAMEKFIKTKNGRLYSMPEERPGGVSA
jgi:saccharopine dehydrogenase-like NADP-dependent oxidoreductase